MQNTHGGGKSDSELVPRRPPCRELVFRSFDLERNEQDDEWGGPSHDDEHDPEDWASFIFKQYRMLNDDIRNLSSNQQADIRRRFIKIGALATAALESMDRRE